MRKQQNPDECWHKQLLCVYGDIGPMLPKGTIGIYIDIHRRPQQDPDVCWHKQLLCVCLYRFHSFALFLFRKLAHISGFLALGGPEA